MPKYDSLHSPHTDVSGILQVTNPDTPSRPFPAPTPDPRQAVMRGQPAAADGAWNHPRTTPLPPSTQSASPSSGGPGTISGAMAGLAALKSAVDKAGK